MHTHVEFRSSKFPAYEGEEEEINPGLWGKRLTEYLVDKLAARGIETDVYVAEDWGYYLPVRTGGPRLALCCGHQNGDDDQFLVFTNPPNPIVKKLFRTIDATPQFTRVLDALKEVLAADPDITDIVWCDPR